MDFDDDVVDRRCRLGPLREGDPGCFSGLISGDYCLHGGLRGSHVRSSRAMFGLTSPLIAVNTTQSGLSSPLCRIVCVMEATTEARVPQKLTGKGQATRARILEHAAELIYTKGVHATNNEQLRRAAGVS